MEEGKDQKGKTMDFRVMKQVFPYQLENSLYDMFNDPNFPWFYTGATSSDDQKKKGLASDKGDVEDGPFFTHQLVIKDKGTTQFSDFILPCPQHIQKKFHIKIETHSRVKANLYIKNSGYGIDSYHAPHIDNSNPNMYSFLYYVNDSDGDTFFFDDDMNVVERLRPKKGQGVLFPSNIWHASSTPIKNDKRITLNFIMKVKE